MRDREVSYAVIDQRWEEGFGVASDLECPEFSSMFVQFCQQNNQTNFIRVCKCFSLKASF